MYQALCRQLPFRCHFISILDCPARIWVRVRENSLKKCCSGEAATKKLALVTYLRG